MFDLSIFDLEKGLFCILASIVEALVDSHEDEIFYEVYVPTFPRKLNLFLPQ